MAEIISITQEMELLLRGEKEIEAGEGFELNAVIADADALLKGTQRR